MRSAPVIKRQAPLSISLGLDFVELFVEATTGQEVGVGAAFYDPADRARQAHRRQQPQHLEQTGPQPMILRRGTHPSTVPTHNSIARRISRMAWLRVLPPPA